MSTSFSPKLGLSGNTLTFDTLADDSGSKADSVTRKKPQLLSFRLSRKQSPIPEQPTCPASPWLVTPLFDLLFVCGAAPWIAGILFFLISGAGGAFKPNGPTLQATTIVFVTVSLLIGESHQFTSIIRYYGKFKNREKRYRMERIPFWIIYALLVEIILLASFPQAAQFLFWTMPPLQLIFFTATIAFPAVLLQHVCAQAIAVAQIYCRNAGYNLSPEQQGALNSVSWLLTLTGIFSIAMPFGLEQGHLGDFNFGSIPLKLFAMYFGTTAVFACSVFYGMIIRRRYETGENPPASAMILILNLMLFALLPIVLPAMSYVFLFVPLFFHATQHWALAIHVQKIEAERKQSDTKRPNMKLEMCQLFIPVLFLTIGILFSPTLTSQLGSFRVSLLGMGSETLSVFFSMLVFYMHYFADRVVWRKS
ncbi:MAG TPA: hypothetical protein V6C89_20840 [Drouetiella sp.]